MFKRQDFIKKSNFFIRDNSVDLKKRNIKFMNTWWYL